MKKSILGILMSMLALSQVVAMSGDAGFKTTKNLKDPHQLVNIYATDNDSAKKLGSILYRDRDKYSIFFCKKNAWCEVVDSRDGSTGWISLEKLKEMQQKYDRIIKKNAKIDKLVQYIDLQDKKIIQLQQMFMQMQKNFSVELQRQQVQINNLKQSAYY